MYINNISEALQALWDMTEKCLIVSEPLWRPRPLETTKTKDLKRTYTDINRFVPKELAKSLDKMPPQSRDIQFIEDLIPANIADIRVYDNPKPYLQSIWFYEK